MIRIKENADLKELEKFGFKHKYDENTGEVKEYYIYIEETNRYGDKLGTKVSFQVTTYRSRFLFDRHYKHQWELDDIDWYRKGIPELLYDLTVAGLIEKIED